MKFYRLHLRDGIEPPEDWGRILIPFAGAGLRLHEEFVKDCIIEAGPIIIKDIMSHLLEYVELFDYDPTLEREILRRKSQQDSQDNF